MGFALFFLLFRHLLTMPRHAIPLKQVWEMFWPASEFDHFLTENVGTVRKKKEWHGHQIPAELWPATSITRHNSNSLTLEVSQAASGD